MKRWKKTKRARRRRWPWRHGDWVKHEHHDGNEAKQIATWYRRHGCEAKAALKRLSAAIDRSAERAKAEGRPLPFWHPDCVVHCQGAACVLFYGDQCNHGYMAGRGALAYTMDPDKADQPCPWFIARPPRWTEGMRWHHDRNKALAVI